MNRKEFFKKTCISGACICGFAGIALETEASGKFYNESATQQGSITLVQEWIQNLLKNADIQLDKETTKGILKNCAIVHYNNLNMDSMLVDYVGNLEKFVLFIQEKWGWKIDYNSGTKTLIADENKDYCVCPMVNASKGQKSPAICYCSEGFAEKMFSKVTGARVAATVISSIQRGDKSCKYKIEIG
jgi:predicted hydrocarbon binding protein